MINGMNKKNISGIAISAALLYFGGKSLQNPQDLYLESDANSSYQDESYLNDQNGTDYNRANKSSGIRGFISSLLGGPEDGLSELTAQNGANNSRGPASTGTSGQSGNLKISQPSGNISNFPSSNSNSSGSNSASNSNSNSNTNNNDNDNNQPYIPDEYDREVARSNDPSGFSTSGSSSVNDSFSSSDFFDPPQIAPADPSSGFNGDSNSSDSSGGDSGIINGGGGGFVNNDDDDDQGSNVSDPQSETSAGGGVSSSSGGGGGSVSYECSANSQGGSFPNPINVTLNCNFPLTIRYCLSKDTCCDPEGVDSQAYDKDAGINIGATNGEFCLSYAGTETFGTSSSPTETHNFIINSSFPSLIVNTTRTHLQTTQYNQYISLASDDFGKANHIAGQANYLTNDISGISNCDTLIDNSDALDAPTPFYSLPPASTASLTTSDELRVGLGPVALDYGVNNLVSFVRNESFVLPVSSCMTNQIILQDFDIFDGSPHYAATNDLSDGQLQIQFNSLGSFEASPDTYRGPASVGGTVDSTGFELQTDFIGILYY